MTFVTGVVLAGGASRRLAQDKAGLRLAATGPTLLQRAVSTLEAVSDAVFVVAPADRQYELHDAARLGDRWPGAGPLGGILTALEAIRQGTVLVLACDYPFVSTAVVKALLDHRPDCPSVVACEAQSLGGSRIHPLVGRYDAGYWLPRFRDAFDAGDRSMRQALEHGVICELTVAEEVGGPNALLNLNTAVDLDRARRVAMNEPLGPPGDGPAADR